MLCHTLSKHIFFTCSTQEATNKEHLKKVKHPGIQNQFGPDHGVENVG